MAERITLEELEESLEEKAAKQQELMSALTELFLDADFVKLERRNTIDFEDSQKDLKALFSVDNTTYKYTCYLTTEGDNSVSYSAKGTMDGAEEAAKKFLAEYSDILTEKDIREVDDEIDVDAVNV